MKALTLKAPWAYAVACLGKDVENRVGRLAKQLKPGQVIAIHAGARATWADKTIEAVEVVTGPRIWLSTLTTMFSSRIVALATVERIDPPGEGASMASPWRYPTEWGIVLRDVQPVTSPPIKGQLGLWTLPAEIETKITHQK